MKERYNEMKEEIKKFENVENIKKDMIERRQRLAGETTELATLTRNYQQENQGVSNELNQKREKLRNHEMHGPFTDTEQKIEQNEQLINHLKNYVAEKEEFMNSEPVLNENRSIIDNLNNMLLQEIAKAK